mmetsp:Transcript_15625/g.32863  ORF Transcript_15625/g.32863 Transcript_15625/m.32863 type:complete len:357 (-) Transcript_15625:45-1115(-)
MRLYLSLVAVASSINPVLSSAGEVYLTFDDGPIDATFGVLEVLKETNTKATFFVNGFHIFGEGDENEDNALEAFKRTVAEGHVVANHSWNHMLHNCCNDEGECGAVVCNQIGMWNVRAYQNVDKDTELFHFNSKALRQLIKTQTHGTIAPNDKLHAMGRMPYTNTYRLDSQNSDCACCTTDDVPPWDPSFDCSLEKPTFSAILSALVADELKSSGMDLYGWDLEWGPENWGDDCPSCTLTTAENLADQVIELSTADACKDQFEAHSYQRNYAFCDSAAHLGKVNILTHDFLFEDGPRGQGATTNLPKLRDFILLMKSKGFEFKTLDQYGEMLTGNPGSKSSKSSPKSGKNRKLLIA